MREPGSVMVTCQDCGEQWDYDYDVPCCVCEEPRWDGWELTIRKEAWKHE